MSRSGINGLYAITPDMTDTADLVALTQQALKGGARLVQYRNKTAAAALRLEQAYTLINLCRKFAVPLIINDHLDIAIKVGADGVHLGQEDTPITEARRWLGLGKIVGVSCYNRLESAIEAERQGADYVAFGAFFVSATKPGAVTAAMSLLPQAKRKMRVPVVAIGGITSDNAMELIQQGADAIAVSGALFGASNTRFAAEQLSCLYNPALYPPHTRVIQ